MTSINKFLEFLDENWVFIIIILSTIFGIYQKIRIYQKLSKEEKEKELKSQVDRVIKIVSEIILEKLIVAESDYIEYKKMGTVKRSKVLNEIYEQYPILKEYIDQDYVIKKLDEIIDEGLAKAKKTLEELKNKKEEIVLERSK